MAYRTWRSGQGRIVALLAVALLATAAWTSAASSKPTLSAAGDETVRIALDYSANVNYLGIYVAQQKGWFARQHITVKIIPYANTPAETLVESGTTDLGITYPPDVIINRAKGLRYKAVAALAARNTTGLAVLASSKYTRPAQLDGTLYGGFGIASDEPLVSAVLRGDGVAKPSYKQVVLNTDVIDALAKHRIQYTAVFGGIDDVTAELQGVKLRVFPYRRYLGRAGDYPNVVFVAADSTISKRSAALRRTLAALAEGYEYSAKHPAEAERILIASNRTALGTSERIVTATGNATAKTFVGASGRWGTLSGGGFTALERLLAAGGLVKGDLPPARDLFTNALLPKG
jgi:ABC-type nitrate/sulfonate/bicarbonate transport system substrate-binding protein